MPRSVSFFQSEHSATSARGFMTTTTRTTTTTTTTTTVLRHPRSSSSGTSNFGLRSNNPVFGMRPQPQLDRPTAAAAAAAVDPSAAVFLRKMLEEPHFAEFYANIWSDEEHEKRKKRGRRTSRFTGPLVDIAQVAHVVTTMTDFKADYAPMCMDAFNLWTDKDRAFLRSHEIPAVVNDDDRNQIDHEKGSAAAAAGFESRSRGRSVSANAFLYSERPRRISEASDEGSVDLYVSVPPTAVPGGGFAAIMGRQPMTTSARHSDPLEDSFADSDATEETAGIPSIDRELQRSNTPLIMRPDPDARMKAMLTSSPSADAAVPPPSTKKDGSTVFSVVFMEEHEWSWSVKFLLGIHEPIRHALFVMDRFLEQSYKTQQLPLVLESHVLAFFSWFKTYFVEYLKCQHELKTSVLHPLLQLKFTTKQEIAKTYDEIYEFLAQIQLQERALCSTKNVKDPATWLARLEALQKEIRKLNLTLHGVLNLEEKTLHPALSSTFTEKTFHQYVMPRIFRSIKAKRVVVPWILERSKVWGGEAEQQSIQSMLPFSAKFLYRKLWRPYFMSNVAGAMKNLNEFVDNSGALIPVAVVGDRKADGGACSIQ